MDTTINITIVYNDDKQLESLKKEEFSTSPFFTFIDERTHHGRKDGFKLKSHWGTRLAPLVEVKDNDKVIKVFYSENGNAIEQLIKYLKE